MPIDLSTITTACGIPSDQEQQELDARVRELSGAFAGGITTIREAINAAERKFHAEAVGLIPEPEIGVEPTISAGQRAALLDAAQRAADRRLGEFRAKLIEDSARNREDMLRQLQTAHDRLDLALRATPSAVSLLGMSALGDERRARYESQLAGAGPVTLGNAAIRAVATGDVSLGAAVLARLDGLPKEHRPVHPHDLAEKLVGPRHRELTLRRDRARLALTAAMDADRSLRTGQRDSFAKISRGLASRKLAAAAKGVAR